MQFPENSQSLNPYSYIMNNPLAGTDPTGFASCVVGKGQSCTTLNRDSRSANKLGNTRFMQGEDGQVHAQGSLGGSAQITGTNGTLTAMLGSSPGGNGAQAQSPTGAGGSKDRQATPNEKGRATNNPSGNGPETDPEKLKESANDFLDDERSVSGFLTIEVFKDRDGPHIDAANAYVGASKLTSREANWHTFRNVITGEYRRTYAYSCDAGESICNPGDVPAIEGYVYVDTGHTHYDNNMEFSGSDWQGVTSYGRRKVGDSPRLYLAPQDGRIYYTTPGQAYSNGVQRGSRVAVPMNFQGTEVKGVNISLEYKP